jgi:tetratricopeptide (TPR) repeat protein
LPLRKGTRRSARPQQAAQQLAAGKLDEPAHDNAFESYTKVLELDSQNNDASQGLQNLKKRFIELGRQQRDQGDLPKAISFIERGLKIHPHDEDLKSLQEQLKTELVGHYIQWAHQNRDRGNLVYALNLIESGLQLYPEHKELQTLRDQMKQEVEKQIQIKLSVRKILDEAEQQLAAGKLNNPPGDNALESYHRVLELDPDNADARHGKQNVIDSFVKLAQQELEKGNLDSAILLTQEGLNIDSRYAPLYSLLEKLSLETERRTKVTNMLRQGNTQTNY